MAETNRDEYDVVVMGGGLAGLSFARHVLRVRPETTVLIVERLEHPVPEAAHKVGEATVELSAHYFAEILDLKDHLVNSQIRKMGLRFFPTAQVPPPPLSQRCEVGPSEYLPRLTFQLDRGIFENALGQAVIGDGAEFRHGCRVEDFELNPDGLHTVKVSRDGTSKEIRSRWVIDASGRRNLIKRKLDLKSPSAHDCNAVWFRLAEMIRLDDLVDEEWDPESDSATSWKERVPGKMRWRSTNHLMGKGYWAWLIPMASGGISVGIVSDPKYVPFEELSSFERAVDWLDFHEPELGRAVAKRRDSLLDFKTLRHYAHGSKQVFSSDRWALIGESGVFTDPLYSPGSDFIALANTFVTDLVVKDMEGQPIDELASKSDEFYLAAYQSVLPVWENQYGLMGNPQVWSVKCVWDIFTYFAVLDILYHNGGLTDVSFMETIGSDFGRFILLNHRIQAFFREWDELDPGVDIPHFSDVCLPDIGVISSFARALPQKLDHNALRQRLNENVDFIEDAMRVIMAEASRRCGFEVAARDIDPANFSIGSTPGTDSVPHSGREDSIARATQMLSGLWHGSNLVSQRAPAQ